MAFRITNNRFNYDGDPQKNSIEQIAIAEKRLAKKKEALDDIKNEYNLIEEQTFKIYKDNVVYLQLNQKGFIDESKQWLKMLSKGVDKEGNKLDGRKSYKEKDIYNYYIGYIKDLLGIDSMDNVEFIDYNFGEATIVKFDYADRTWEFTIPMIDNINIKSYRNYGANVFKLRLNIQDKKYSCSWNYVGSTFDENEFKDIMKYELQKQKE